MTDIETELEKFLLWFTDLEEIPAETRRDFLTHLLKVGQIDEKAEKFMTDSLDRLVKVSRQKADELKRKFEAVSAALAGEKIPELSLKENIIKTAGERMMELATHFKTAFRAEEKGKFEEAEKGEKTKEQEEIEKLKAKL